MPDVTARGRALYECDQAAWHATDAVQAMNSLPEILGRYIARKSDSEWVVAFGRLNDQRDHFIVGFEAVEGATLQEFTAKKIDRPQEDAGFYLMAARPIDTALHDFHGESGHITWLFYPRHSIYSMSTLCQPEQKMESIHSAVTSAIS